MPLDNNKLAADAQDAIKAAVAIVGTQEKLAVSLGVKQQSVSKWLTGIGKPSFQIAYKIETLTAGAVKKEQLRPDIFKPKIEAA